MGNGGSGARAQGLAAQRRGGASAVTTAVTAVTPKTPSKATPKETVHGQAARLRQEQGLTPEVTPQPGKAFNQHLEQVGASHDVSHIDPYGASRVQDLQAQYGEHQLGAALNRLNDTKLRESVAQYNRETGAKIPLTDAKGRPTARATLLTAVTQHATQGRYTADFKAALAQNKASAKESATKAKAERATAAQARKDEATARAASRPAKTSTAAPTKALPTAAQYDQRIARAEAKAMTLAKASDAEHAAARAAGPHAEHHWNAYGGPAKQAYLAARTSLNRLYAARQQAAGA